MRKRPRERDTVPHFELRRKKRPAIFAATPYRDVVLKQLTIANFRSIERATIEVGRWTVLYGANGSGKSSILDALNILSSYVAGAAPGMIFNGVFAVDKQVHDSESGPIKFGVKHRVGPYGAAEFDDIEYSVSFVSSGSSTEAAEQLVVNGAAPAQSTGSRGTDLAATGLGDHEAADELLSAHRFARRFRIEPRQVRRAAAEHRFIEPNGAGLPSALQHMCAQHPDAFEALVRDFLRIFPEVTDLRTAITGAGVWALEFDTASAAALSGAFLSDGQALALAILFLAHSPTAPRLLALDEPEVTLSPVAVQRLLGVVDEALAADRQVLLTTHSPYVLRWAIHEGHQAVQVGPRFGSRTWRESLRAQAIDPETIHSEREPMGITHACALLETYLSD